MNKSFKICNTNDLDVVCKHLENLSTKGRNIIVLNGDLGAGKTTLVKTYIHRVNKEVQVDSPTFALVNDYVLNEGTIHHFDLYRLNAVEDIEDIGFWDYVDSGNTCFIEWPDKIADLLPEEKRVKVDIKLLLNECREFTLSY